MGSSAPSVLHLVELSCRPGVTPHFLRLPEAEGGKLRPAISDSFAVHAEQLGSDDSVGVEPASPYDWNWALEGEFDACAPASVLRQSAERRRMRLASADDSIQVRGDVPGPDDVEFNGNVFPLDDADLVFGPLNHL